MFVPFFLVLASLTSAERYSPYSYEEFSRPISLRAEIEPLRRGLASLGIGKFEFLNLKRNGVGCSVRIAVFSNEELIDELLIDDDELHSIYSAIDDLELEVVRFGECNSQLVVVIVGGFFDSNDPAPKSIMDPKSSNIRELLDYEGESVVQALSKRVVRLAVHTVGGSFEPCTGFVLPSRRVLTAAHCLIDIPKAGDRCENVYVYTNINESYFIGRCSSILRIDALGSDYVLFSLSCRKWCKFTDDEIGRYELVGEEAFPVDAFVLHHPQKKSLRVSQFGCRVEKKIPSFSDAALGLTIGNLLLHTCDTEGGSSGAPIFTSSGLFIGLHFRGFPENCHQPDCRINYALQVPIDVFVR